MKQVSLAGAVVLISGAVAVLGLQGCSSLNQAATPRTTSLEYMRSFDVKTKLSVDELAKAINDGITKNVNRVDAVRSPAIRGELPAKPGQMQLVDILAGQNTGLLAVGLPNGYRVPKCDGVAWRATANRTISNESDLRMTICVFQYAGGYSLDMHGFFTEREGGLFQLSRATVSAVMGTPKEAAEKTFIEVVKSVISQANAKVALTYADPQIQGTPWLQ
jgi:hypothetical protein